MLAKKTLLILMLGAALGTSTGCKPTPVRGEDVEGLDEEAMSTGLDRRDLQKMLHENMEALQKSAVIRRWESEDHPRVAVLPIRNETSEHIDSGLQSLITDIETTLVNAGHVRVISQDMQGELVEEVRRQQTDAYNPEQVARWGRQVGARYFVTGKVFSVDERHSGERRVQYSLFIRVLDAETGDILFQNKSSVTKALIK